MTTRVDVPSLEHYDLLIVGGGINGAGIARDAAGRGLSVLLVEAEDLASHTSSASTKLIHGGLRYLEYYEFRLVRESLIERERLLGAPRGSCASACSSTTTSVGARNYPQPRQSTCAHQRSTTGCYRV
jgi:glycerol-3-phosphate dehydrogenase